MGSALRSLRSWNAAICLLEARDACQNYSSSPFSPWEPKYKSSIFSRLFSMLHPHNLWCPRARDMLCILQASTIDRLFCYCRSDSLSSNFHFPGVPLEKQRRKWGELKKSVCFLVCSMEHSKYKSLFLLGLINPMFEFFQAAITKCQGLDGL